MIAAVFPGQGSQKPGMGRELFTSSPEAAEIFDRASEATGVDVRALCTESDEDTLRQTQNAQLALFTCGCAAYAALKSTLPVEHWLAGHSVGEFAAVVASGALAVEDGARLVQTRGRLMADAGSRRPGAMAAILGLDRESLESVCRGASTADEVAVIANDNCPGQLVISGDAAAVQRAMVGATGAGAKRALPLNVSGAFHSPLMQEAAAQFGEALRAAPWHEQRLTVVANVTAEPVEHGREWAELFQRQLESPVRWTESVQRLGAAGVEIFVECGAGDVLSGLIRRTLPGVRTLAVHDAATLDIARAECAMGTPA